MVGMSGRGIQKKEQAVGRVNNAVKYTNLNSSGFPPQFNFTKFFLYSLGLIPMSFLKYR